jgi:hypothetical protein
MDAKLWQPCPDARIVPAVEKGNKGFACALVQKNRRVWEEIELNFFPNSIHL